MKNITIIGAGLTGSLLAILLGRRGYSVHIFERNPDPRHTPLVPGKSINLTLCKRGINSLEKIGLSDEILKLSSPVYGRYLHLKDGSNEIQLYGNKGEAIHSISRYKLSSLLLSTAEKIPNVKITYNMKCIGYDLASSTITFDKNDQNSFKVQFDTLIAADGVNSAIRSQMQKKSMLNYSQFFSTHANKELTIPAENAIEFDLAQNYLHIWPRDEYMLICFPNPDKSLTCHLQIPIDNNEYSFKSINSKTKLYSFFSKFFPSAIQLMPKLVEEFFQNPEIPMLTVRCMPWHISDKILLVGDAAHGIWPSYGQGVNAAFEDCDSLEECFNLHPLNIESAFKEFQNRRKEHVDTIANLSENHTNEIRSLVVDPKFILKKKLERKINLLFPTKYLSLYSRIAFTTTPYKTALNIDQSLKQTIDELLTFPQITIDIDSADSEKLIRNSMSIFFENPLHN